MSVKETKKSKGFKPGSRKGSRMQYLSNKIKEAKENGYAWLTYKNRRLKISTKLDLDSEFNQALIKGKGRIRLINVTYKDGIKAYDESGKIFYLDFKNFLAWVIENHKIFVAKGATNDPPT